MGKGKRAPHLSQLIANVSLRWDQWSMMQELCLYTSSLTSMYGACNTQVYIGIIHAIIHALYGPSMVTHRHACYVTLWPIIHGVSCIHGRVWIIILRSKIDYIIEMDYLYGGEYNNLSENVLEEYSI